MVLAQLHGQEATAYCTVLGQTTGRGLTTLGANREIKRNLRYKPSVMDGPLGTGFVFVAHKINSNLPLQTASFTTASACLM